MRRAALLALALFAGGCGSGASTRPETTASGPLPSAHVTPVRIDAPRNDATLRARFDASGDVSASTVVQGWGDPRAAVLVSSGCREDRCHGVARADAQGRWRVRLRLVGTPSRLTLPIDAVYADASDEGARAAVRVRLRAPASVARRRAARALVVIGDALAPRPGSLLRGWTVRVDARPGRSLAEGLRVLAASDAPSDAVLAFSLFTADAPGDVGALESAVRASARRASCVIWATISHPPVGGASYDAANARLEQLAEGELAGHLVVVPWADAVADHPGWVEADAVQATPDGARARARMYARAARRCRAATASARR